VRKSATSTGKAPVKPKYRSKSNSDLTWTGRGRKPAWVADHLASGGTLNEITFGA